MVKASQNEISLNIDKGWITDTKMVCKESKKSKIFHQAEVILVNQIIISTSSHQLFEVFYFSNHLFFLPTHLAYHGD